MPFFIKTGFWEEKSRGFKSWLNLNDIILSISGAISDPVVLTDSSTITIENFIQTLSSSSATKTVSISFSGNEMILELTLNTTAAVYTFPVGTLCVSEGVASGGNTCSLAGVSGNKYIIAIQRVGSNFYVVAKNFSS
jgi:hypothetical protein